MPIYYVYSTHCSDPHPHKKISWIKDNIAAAALFVQGQLPNGYIFFHGNQIMNIELQKNSILVTPQFFCRITGILLRHKIKVAKSSSLAWVDIIISLYCYPQ